MGLFDFTYLFSNKQKYHKNLKTKKGLRNLFFSVITSNFNLSLKSYLRQIESTTTVSTSTVSTESTKVESATPVESEAALSESAVFPAQLIIIEVANIATHK